MAYKVMKKELVRKRPEWLVQFLMRLSPDVYEAKDRLVDARRQLQTIVSTITDSHLLEFKTKLHLLKSTDSVEIRTEKERTIVRFFIDYNYRRI